MHSKLAGHLPLQDLIQQTIESARVKTAESDKVKKLVEYEKKEHGHVPSVKEEKEECEKEKNSSAIDFSDHDDVVKLAAALDFVADDFLKQADKVELGGESHQGGMVLPTGTPVSGTQPYKKDGSKQHQVPMSTGTEKVVDNPGASTAVPTNMGNPAGHKSTYPAKGVLKTGSVARLERALEKKAFEPSVLGAGLGVGAGALGGAADAYTAYKAQQHHNALRQAMVDEAGGPESLVAQQIGPELKPGHAAALAGIPTGLMGAFTGGVMGAAGGPPAAAMGLLPGALGSSINMLGGHFSKKDLAAHQAKMQAQQAAQGVPPAPAGGPPPGEMPKQSAAVNFIMGKIANVEKQMGGMTLDSPSQEGPKPPTDSKGGNGARRFINNIFAAIKMKKVDGKSPQKPMLAEVLNEPALSRATDSKVHENLRNATAGGVKIAAQRALLQKIAEDKDDPRHEKLASAIGKKHEKDEKKQEKDSQFAGAQSGPMSGVPTPNVM